MFMKAGKHSVPGSKDVRKSPRVYSHAVVCNFDFAAAAEATSAYRSEMAAQHWDYESAQSKRSIEDVLKEQEKDGRLWDGSRDFWQDALDKAVAFAKANPDRA